VYTVFVGGAELGGKNIVREITLKLISYIQSTTVTVQLKLRNAFNHSRTGIVGSKQDRSEEEEHYFYPYAFCM
jgi:hypothetical protein